LIALIPVEDFDADIKKAVRWRPEIEGVVGVTLNEAKSFELAQEAVQVIFPRNTGLLEICSITGTFEMGQVDDGKCSSHKGINDRFPLIGKELNEDEDKHRHAGCLRTETILAAKIEKIALMRLQPETELAKEILKGGEVISQSPIDLPISGTDMPTATKLVEDLLEHG
jgi:hypothetical protein